MTNYIHARARAAKRQFAINKPFFVSPNPAGRKITAGFSYLQRIGKSANIDVWFPEILRQELEALVAEGAKLGPEHFPAEWAAVRQFELLQEAGNYKIYDMDASYLTRTMEDLARNMRSGGYRVTVATIGGYAEAESGDDLAILDRRLQDRISRLTHMMYLDEESERINAELDQTLVEERWDYQNTLPHVGMTLGAKDLFRPSPGVGQRVKETVIIPVAPYQVTAQHIQDWRSNLGVEDAVTGKPFICVKTLPKENQYRVDAGVYQFALMDCGRDVVISYLRKSSGAASPAENRHRLARHFFDILSVLPQKHIVHDTAIGLQLPESIAEHEWIYLAAGDMKLGAFNSLLNDLFAPFDGISLGGLNGRAGAGREIKSSVVHMRSYGDHMHADRAGFYRDAAASLHAAQPV